MTNILVYDIEAETLEKEADKRDITVAELIELLVEFIDEV